MTLVKIAEVAFAVVMVYFCIGFFVALFAARRERDKIMRFNADHADLGQRKLQSIFNCTFIQYALGWAWYVTEPRPPQGPPRQEMIP